MFREIYIDESSQTANRYLVLGALILPLEDTEAAVEAMARARLPELPAGEMKWGKVSKSKLPAYTHVVDLFFESDAFSRAHFHSIVVDTSGLDHEAYNSGSADIGFSKEIYQLAQKCARLYPDDYFHVYPDQRPTAQRTEELRTILNMGRRKTGDARDWTFRRCHFRDSRITPLLSFSDLFAGSIAYHLNGHIGKPEASPHKVELAKHIISRGRVRDVNADTAMSGKFTIWHRRLRPVDRVPRR